MGQENTTPFSHRGYLKRTPLKNTVVKHDLKGVAIHDSPIIFLLWQIKGDTVYTDYGYIGKVDGILYATEEEARAANPDN